MTRGSRPLPRPSPLGVSLARFASLAAMCGALAAGSSRAATLFFDSDALGSNGITEGTGGAAYPWLPGTTATFFNGTSTDVATSPGDIVWFGNGGTIGTSPTVINVGTGTIGGLAFGATTSFGYSLTNTASSTLTLGGGGLVVNAGAQATSVGSANLSLALGASASFVNNSAALLTFGGALNNGGNLLTLSTTSTGGETLTGAISGAGGLTVNGFAATTPGAVTLTGSSTFTGPTTVNAGGSLKLDFSASGAPGSNIINSTGNNSALALNGGLLTLTGSTGGTNTQRFNGLTVGSGAATITGTLGSATSLALDLGAITHTAGGTLNFSVAPTAAIVANTSSANADVAGTTTGLLGAWATVGSGTATAYATVSGGSITTYTGATTATATTLANVTSASSNYTYAAAASPAGSRTANTLQYTGAATTTALAGSTLTLNGFLNTGTGVVTFTRTGAGGLVIGSTSELVFQGPVGDTVQVPISDNGTIASSLTMSGAGVLTLSTSASTYSGTTTVNSGTLTLGLSNVLSSASGIVLNGGTLGLGVTNQSVNSLSVRGGSITGTGALVSATDFDLQNGSISAALGGNVGAIKTTPGTVVLSGSSNFTGNLSIYNGIVRATTPNNATGGFAGLGGLILLGNPTPGNFDNATLAFTAVTFTMTSPITVQAGSKGMLTISEANSTGNPAVFSGPITLNNNLGIEITGARAFGFTGMFDATGTGAAVAISKYGTSNQAFTMTGPIKTGTGGVSLNLAGTGTMAFSGGVNGSGPITFNNNSGNAFNVSGGDLNPAGLITNSGSGTLNTISSNIGSAVTGIVQNSATSNLTLTGTGGAFSGASGITVNAGTLTLPTMAGTAFYHGSGPVSVLGGLLTLATTGVYAESPLGSGTLTLAPGATISFNSNLITDPALFLTGANPITIANAAGTATFQELGYYTHTGAVTFAAGAAHPILNLRSTSSGLGTLTFTGGAIGPGDILFTGSDNSSRVAVTGAALNNTGSITAGTGVAGGLATIDAPIGDNVTSIAVTSNFALTINSAVPLLAARKTFTSTGSAGFIFGGGFTGSQDLTLQANSTGLITVSGPLSHAGSITNSGSSSGVVTLSGAVGSSVTAITQDSAGSVLVLSGTNVSSAPVTVKQGTLKLGSATAAGNGLVTIGSTGNSTILDLAAVSGNASRTVVQLATGGAAASQTISNSTAVAATLNFAGGATPSTFAGIIKNTVGAGSSTTGLSVTSGSLTLTATNLFTGATSVSGGTLTIDTGGSLANTAVAVSGTGTLALKVANALTGTAAVSVSGGSLNLQDIAAISTRPLTLSGGTVQLRSDTDNATFATSGSTVAVTASSTIDVDRLNTGTSRTLKIATSGVTLGISTLTATGGHGYSLALGPVTNSSATASASAINSNIAGGGMLTLPSFAYTANTVAQTVTFGGSGQTLVTGAITQNGTNTAKLAYAGTGALTLQGSTASNFTGGVVTNNGTLVLNGSIDNLVPVSNAFTPSGGALTLQGSSQTFASIAPAAGASSIIIKAGRSLTITSTTAPTFAAGAGLNLNTAAGLANAGTSTLGTSVMVWNGTATVGAPLNNGFTVTDAGGTGFATVDGSKDVVRLVASNLLPASGSAAGNFLIDNHAGSDAGGNALTTASQSATSLTIDTTANAGTLTLGANAKLTNSAYLFVSSGGTNNFEIKSSGTTPGSFGLVGNGTGASIFLNNYSAGAVTISAPILVNTTQGVTINGTGTTLLTGANTYTGATTVNGTSTVHFGGTMAASSIAIDDLANVLVDTATALSSANNLSFGAASAGQFSLQGHDLTIGTLASNTLTGSPIAQNAHADSVTLTLSGTGGNFAGVIQDGAGGGTLALKVTTGAVVLSGANTYTGGTSVTGGSLNASGTGALPAASLVTVESSGTLIGGAVNGVLGPIAVKGGALQPNANGAFGTGTITFTGTSTVKNTVDVALSNPLVLAAGAVLKYNSSNSRNLSYTGSISGDATTLVDLTNLNAPADTVTVLSADLSNYFGEIDYNGPTAISQSRPTINGTNGATSAKTRFVLSGPASGPATAPGSTASILTLSTANAGGFHMGSLAGTGGAINVGATGGLVVGELNSMTSFAGTLRGTVAATSGLTKAGFGSLTLSGDNTYLGATTISAGILIAGSTAGSTAVSNVALTMPANTDTFTLASGTLVNGNAVFLAGTTAATNFGLGNIYYVVETPAASNTIKLAATPNGPAITTGITPGASLTASRTGAFGSTNTAILLGDASTTANNSSPALLTGGAVTIERPVTIANQPVTGSAFYSIGGGANASSTFISLITVNQPLTITQVTTSPGNALSFTGGITGNKRVTFAGPGAINVAGNVFSDTGGSLAIAVTNGVSLTLGANNTYTGSTTVMGGKLIFGANNSGANALSITTAGAKAEVSASTLTGAPVEVTPNNQAVPAGATTKLLSATSLSLAGGTILNLTNNGLLVDYTGASIYGELFKAVKNGFSAGSWDGSIVADGNSGVGAVTSSSALTDTVGGIHYLTAIGIVDNADISNPSGTISSTFLGRSADRTSVFLRYTLYGDANLDGRIDSADYAQIDNAYAMTHNLSGEPISSSQVVNWYNGDFNYDGVIDGTDYALIDNANAFSSGTGPAMAALMQEHAEQFGESYTQPAAALAAGTGLAAVPEPGALALLSAGALLLGLRRRRKV